VFFEHISFFSIPTSSHYLTTSNVIKLNPFDINDTKPSFVPTLDLVFEPIIDTTSEFILVDLPTTHAQSFVEVTVPLPPTRPNRNCKSTQQPDFVYSSYSSSFVVFISFVCHLLDPSSYGEVVCDPLWQNVMAGELVALYQTHIWDLVPLLPGKHSIGSRWVYKIKIKLDGSIER